MMEMLATNNSLILSLICGGNTSFFQKFDHVLVSYSLQPSCNAAYNDIDYLYSLFIHYSYSLFTHTYTYKFTHSRSNNQCHILEMMEMLATNNSLILSLICGGNTSFFQKFRFGILFSAAFM